MQLVNFILGSFSLLIQQYADYYQEQNLADTLTQLNNDLGLPCIQTYDYIVVGGGSAGCIVASRLSEKHSVLLLESGGDPVRPTSVQYLDDFEDSIRLHPAINSIFHSTQQKYFSLSTGGLFRIPTGHMLSGSGSHNANNYNRGSPQDYDYFANLTQDDSWSYARVLKYFKKLENYVGHLINEEERETNYGSGGPINIVTANHPPRLLPHWLAAGKELGFSVGDPNTQQSQSFTPIALSTRGGVKDSTYISYIKPIEATRKTLTVLRYSQVEKVLIHDNKTAYGVTFLRHGIPQIAHASKEVILSAGAISTPLLLFKSGIGSRAVLHKAKIPVVAHLPGVGQNLQDHSATFLEFRIRSDNATILPPLTDATVEKELLKFQSPNRHGLFATTLEMGQAFLVSSRAVADHEENWSDSQLVLQQFPSSNHSQTLRIFVVLGRQKSVGQVRFNTSAYRNGIRDDTQLAIMDHRYFTERSDVDVLVEGIKVALNVIETTEAFKRLHPEYMDTGPEACKVHSSRSDKYWKCYIQYRTMYWHHLAGTAKMGAPSDPNAVVDSKLRVRGVSRLRVVDASILPRTTNSNLNAPTMMVAEKGVDDIMGISHPTKETTSDNSY